MKSGKQVPETLYFLFQCHGVPRRITVDEALELVAGDFKKKCLKAGVHHKAIECLQFVFEQGGKWYKRAKAFVNLFDAVYECSSSFVGCVFAICIGTVLSY
jgi:hypothetical protein